MAALPYFPLWIDAYIVDCAHLDDAEHGRYFQLLMVLWRAPQQRLPNDDAWLARKFRRSVERVQAELRPIIDEFCQCDAKWITQKRLSREWGRSAGAHRARSEAAKSRWNKEKGASPVLFASGAPNGGARSESPKPLRSHKKGANGAYASRTILESKIHESRARADMRSTQLPGPDGPWRFWISQYAPGGRWPSKQGPRPESDDDNPAIPAVARRAWRRLHGLPQKWGH